MENQQVKAKNEGEFVVRVNEKTLLVHELQERISLLRDILQPYSVNPPLKDKDDQKETVTDTKMGNALLDLEYAIQDTHKQIDRLIENFRG